MAFLSTAKHFHSMKNLYNCNLSLPIKTVFNKMPYFSSISLLELLHDNAKSIHITPITSHQFEKVNDVATIKPTTSQQNKLLKNDGIWEDSITSADVPWIKTSDTDVLEPCQEDVSDISKFTSPSFNLAAYVNQSETLQELVKMGVNLNKIENRKGAAECILKLDFEKHIKEHLRFLHDYGLPAEQFGYFVTKNPFIFEQNLEDLQVRINYLEAKKFIPSSITRIITKNPFWLNFSTVEIDKRLGFFQRTFVLSGFEVRLLAEKRPTLITYDLGQVSISLFAVREDMGFNDVEAKALLLSTPKLYHLPSKAVQSRFDYVHNVMEISHEQILQHPTILLFRNHIVKERHEFLKEIGKAQYNPKLPGYVSLETLVHGNDVEFCTYVAKTSVEVFNTYLKTR